MSLVLRRLAWLLVAGLLLAALGYLAFHAQPIDVDLSTVARGRLQVTVDEDGKTRIRDRYVVSSPLAGRLVRIDMDPGDTVVRGNSLLATIEPQDPSLLDARELASADARVKAQQAALERAQPQLEQARVALELAETELGRARKLRTTAAISKQELARRESEYRMRSEEYRAARFSEKIIRYELEMARAALTMTQGEDPSGIEPKFQIHAPISGRVLRVIQESTMVVAAGTPLLELGDPEDLEVEVDVLSSDAVKIQPGAHVLLEQWGGQTPLSGIVRLVEPSAFTKVSALGVEEQRVNVIIDFVNSPEDRSHLGDGFRVEARIVIWEATDVLIVPMSGLFRIGDDWAVFIVNNDHVTVRRIRVGHRNAMEGEVLEGLASGDQIVLHPSDKLVDGSLIAPRSLRARDRLD